MNDIKVKRNQLSQIDIQQYFEKNVDMLREMFERVDLIVFSAKISTYAVHFSVSDQDDIIGFMAAYCNDEESKIAYITTISISPKYQGKGLGKKLLEEGIKYARQKGYLYVRLQVRKANIIALKFYEGFGFQKVETCENSFFLEKAINQRKVC